MKILLFSDSHGYTRNMERAIAGNPGVDMIIHLGDYVKDVLKIMDQRRDLRYEYVRGNNDWAQDYPLEKTLHIEGRKIFITHGHIYRVKYGYDMLVDKGKSLGADAVFFGHTHSPEELHSDGMLLLNPGSIAIPVEPCRPSCCVVEISKEKVLSRFKSFN
ncbi:MAG: metallophosphoesterase [Clostridiales bacterium]|nr:metallophosphoesterase [Eubacteriales bacterium]MDH7567104.1 metallophosphoesterase [Clostridiales bacterium]